MTGNRQWKKGYSVRLEQKSQNSFPKSHFLALLGNLRFWGRFLRFLLKTYQLSLFPLFSPSHPSPPCLKPSHPSLPHASSPCLKPSPFSSPCLKPMPSPCLKPSPSSSPCLKPMPSPCLKPMPQVHLFPLIPLYSSRISGWFQVGRRRRRQRLMTTGSLARCLPLTHPGVKYPVRGYPSLR